MKDYDKNKELSYLKYWIVNNFYGWVMPLKLPVNWFKWVDAFSEFNNLPFLPEKKHNLEKLKNL